MDSVGVLLVVLHLKIVNVAVDVASNGLEESEVGLHLLLSPFLVDDFLQILYDVDLILKNRDIIRVQSPLKRQRILVEHVLRRLCSLVSRVCPLLPCLSPTYSSC